MSDYTAANIQILDSKTLRIMREKRVKNLSNQYPGIAISFIARLLESCQLSGFPEELAIKRYLMKDKSIVPSQELIECHKELLQRLFRS